MKIQEAIQILERHNLWRRGADVPQQDPAEIGMAIEMVLHEVKQCLKINELISKTKEK